MNTLVIDTSFGSTVGITGHEPICEQDSRTHVEKLQHDIAQVCAEAKIQPHDIERIVVGIGPAPFTGLRAGIVAAKAIAYATGAQLLGQDSLSGQAAMMQAAYNGDPNLLNTAIFGNWNTPANAGTALPPDPQRQRRAPQTALLHPARKHQRRHQRRTHPTRHEHRHAIEHRGQSKRSGRHHTATPSRPAGRRRHRRTRCKQIRANLERTTLARNHPRPFTPRHRRMGG